MTDKTIVVRLAADSGQFVSAMLAAGGSVQTMGNQAAAGATKATASVRTLGETASAVGKITTLGVAAGLALSAKAAIDFESSFAGVRKTLDATEGQFTTLENEIRGLSKEIPISVNELNRIAELGGQLGIGVTGIPEFVRVIGEIGATTNLSTEQAALGFARLDNILGLGQKSFRELGSSIVDLGNNFATTEDEILTFSLRIAPIARTVGIAADEVLAISTAFSSVGVPAERGGTAVQKALISIDEAAQSGGKSLMIFAEVAGVTADEFQALARQDPAKAFSTFITGLGRLRREGGNVFATLDQVGLGSSRVVQSLLAMASASGVLVDALGLSEDAWETNIALTEEAEKRFETTASKMTLAKNQIQDLGIALGQELLPYIGDLADGFGDLLFAVEQAGPLLKAIIGIIVGGIAGITAANLAYKALTKTIGVDLVAAMNAGKIATATFTGLFGVAFLGVITVLTTALSRWGAEQKDAAEKTNNLADAIERQREGMEGLVKETIKNQLVADGYLTLLNSLGISVGTFVDAVLGESSALSNVNGILDGYIKRSEEATNALENQTNATGLTAEEQARLVDEAKRFGEQGGLAGRVQELLIKNQGYYTDAIALTNQELQDLNLAAVSQGYRSLADQIVANEIAERNAGKQTERTAKGYAILSDTIEEDVIKAVESYAELITDSFGETDEALRSQIDLWYEMGDAVAINVDEIISNVTEQITTQRQFVETLGDLGVTGVVRDMFLSWSLEQQAGFNALAESAPQDAARLVEFMNKVWGPGGEIYQTAITAFDDDLPNIIKEGGTAMVQAFSGIVDQVQTETGATPVEAWLGVMETAIINAPADLRPLIATALDEVFREGGFSGRMFGLGSEGMAGFIAGLRSQFPELFAALFGMTDRVESVVRNGFEMRSPSRKMMMLGQLVGEGFVQGIHQGFEGLHSVGTENLGIPNRHTLVAGATTNVSTTTNDNRIEISVSGSDRPGEDAQANLLAAGLVSRA